MFTSKLTTYLLVFSIAGVYVTAQDEALDCDVCADNAGLDAAIGSNAAGGAGIVGMNGAPGCPGCPGGNGGNGDGSGAGGAGAVGGNGGAGTGTKGKQKCNTIP